ncbi:MAG: sugar phosphate nucleotidyltransferase [Spirochaetes bacterium]|nr:sugar phosphate nucleotidyltransferase [Spirochaetota bacterium]
MKIVPIILAGGAGTRLWPLSRDDMPKQYHNLTGEGTLLNETILRISPLKPNFYLIATAKKYKEMSLASLKEVKAKGRVLSEPLPKNTAAAVLYSALYLKMLFNDAIMIVLPADHFIKHKDRFVKVLRTAIAEAEKENLVTLGIKPSYPETGYGYIKAKKSSQKVMDVDHFVEKPDKETALKYLQDGGYFWNSGIYIWKASVIIDCFKRLMKNHYKAFEPLTSLKPEEIEEDKGRIWKLKEKIFSSIDSISIDYGILEKADKRVVIPCNIGWTDLGSWNAIDEILKPDGDNNRTPLMENTIFVNSSNCSVFADTKRVALVGVENLVVVESGDSILVMDKNKNQEVRKVVEIIKNKV